MFFRSIAFVTDRLTLLSRELGEELSGVEPRIRVLCHGMGDQVRRVCRVTPGIWGCPPTVRPSMVVTSRHREGRKAPSAAITVG